MIVTVRSTERRLRLVLAAGVLLLLAGAVPGHAQIYGPPGPLREPLRPGVNPDAQRKLDGSVVECVKTVRKDRSSEKFDAYTVGPNVRIYGSPEERADFEKCMAREGQTVK